MHSLARRHRQQPVALQKCLRPGVAPGKLVVADQMLVEVLGGEVLVALEIQLLDAPLPTPPEPAWTTACPAVDRLALQGPLPHGADTSAGRFVRLPPESLQPRPGSVPHPPSAPLPSRTSCASVLAAALSVASSPPRLERFKNRTDRVLQEPVISCAIDTILPIWSISNPIVSILHVLRTAGKHGRPRYIEAKTTRGPVQSKNSYVPHNFT